MQGSRLDQVEIGGGNAAHLHDMIDTAEQVIVGRIGLIHYRRTDGIPVVDENVHRISLKRGAWGAGSLSPELSAAGLATLNSSRLSNMSS